MTRLNRSVPVSRSGALALGFMLCGSAAQADQILEIHDDSLTTYLPSSKSNIQDIRPLVDQRGVNIDGSSRGGARSGSGLPDCLFISLPSR